MRITQIVASVDEEAAGPSYTVPRLAQSLATHPNTEVAMATLGAPSTHTESGVTHTRYARDYTWAGPLAQLGASAAMRAALMAQERDIFHTHGLWMMPNIYPAKAASRHGGALLLSPRGMLGEGALQFSSLKKKVVWHLLQKKAANAVDCFHATSEQEYADIRAFGLSQPVAVIPNGIDLPDLGALPATPKTSQAMKSVVSLGRVHPKKALDRLIEAWARLEPDYPDWQLRIIGPSEVGYDRELQALVKRLGAQRVSIEEPVFGPHKYALMRDAELFALSTLHENFGMTVAESLAVETPVVSTIGAPWEGLETEGCGWWIDHGTGPMKAALRGAMALSDSERAVMGQRGRQWMLRAFAWKGIAQSMFDAYTWLSNGAEPSAAPTCVRLD